MKFGKTLRLESNLKWNTRWADGYVEYKRLKMLIRRLAEMSEEEEKKLQRELYDTPRTVERRGSVSTLILGSDDLSDEDTNHDGKNASPKASVVRHTSAYADESDVPDFPVSFKPTRNFIKRSFLETYRREVIKVYNFCRERIDNTVSKIAALRREVQEQSDETQTSQQQSERRKRMIRLSIVCERLETFVTLNYTGLEKIAKKFDKQMAAAEKDLGPGPGVLQQVETLFNNMRDAHMLRIGSAKSELFGILESLGSNATIGEKEAIIAQESEEEPDDPHRDQIPVKTHLGLDSCKPGTVTRFRLVMSTNGIGYPITVPTIVVKGKYPGPVLGITSALHGNELNGIPLIFRLIRELSVDDLYGTIVAVPVLNVPGFLRHQRGFHDGSDLNRLFPGKKDGTCGQVYAYNVLERLVKHFDYHIDLHTASFGRVNSLYVRADMNHSVTNAMALLQEAQIVLHNTAPDGSLRSAAMKLGIPSITVEIGDPSRIHRRFVSCALIGVENILNTLHMIRGGEDGGTEQQPVLCSRSFWMFSKHGGLLTVLPAIATWVHEGEIFAQIRNSFGDIVATYRAKQDGIVVGKSVNPVCAVGDRLIHLGIVGSSFPEVVHDGHE